MLLGDDTYVGGLHMVGMETKRLDCLYAMIETPGCANSEGNFKATAERDGAVRSRRHEHSARCLNCCGAYTRERRPRREQCHGRGCDCGRPRHEKHVLHAADRCVEDMSRISHHRPQHADERLVGGWV